MSLNAPLRSSLKSQHSECLFNSATNRFAFMLVPLGNQNFSATIRHCSAKQRQTVFTIPLKDLFAGHSVAITLCTRRDVFPPIKLTGGEFSHPRCGNLVDFKILLQSFCTHRPVFYIKALTCPIPPVIPCSFKVYSPSHKVQVWSLPIVKYLPTRRHKL